MSSHTPSTEPLEGAVQATRASGEAIAFVRRAVAFALVGALVYGGVYAWSESLVYQYGKRNRFFMVRTAPLRQYDVVILGASHAAVFDYDDMNARLESLTGMRILNLSVVGGGIVVNRLLLDYFLASRQAGAVVYVADSFTFTSPAWNEVRAQDTNLFARAPFDPVLARLLLTTPATRGVALPYILGFPKVNNANRFVPDVQDDEGARFDRTYRPVGQIDQRRLDYLYPTAALEDRASHDRYFGLLGETLGDLRARGIRAIVIKPPVPERIYRQLPGEGAFDLRLRELTSRHGAELHDFSTVNNDETLFYDVDHLNRAGVTRFFDQHLAPLLRHAASAPSVER